MKGEIIYTSIFDIFKIGPGPSSSHMIGPMKAGNSFRKYALSLHSNELESVNKIRVELYGSLSATGLGHGTHRAVAAGIIGWTPDNCDPERVLSLFEKEGECYDVDFHRHNVKLCKEDIVFMPLDQGASFPYANTLLIKLMDDDTIVLEKEFYSIGGGFILCKGEKSEEPGEPLYKYTDFDELKQICKENNKTIEEVVIENEMAITGAAEHDIYRKISQIINTMEDSVEHGLHTEGLLPGPIKLERKAGSVFKAALTQTNIVNTYLIQLNSYALAASEENAAGRIVVTAPTSGSSGLIPGVLYYLRHNMQMTKRDAIRGLIVAVAIAFIARNNASIAGAEVGCQGEVGVAASMGAAMIAAAHSDTIDTIETGATIALEHYLGLTCDPIGGYVQIPCIERNADGAAKAYNSYLLATSKHSKEVSFDEVVETMMETGKDMSDKYRETAKGGLAVLTSIRC